MQNLRICLDPKEVKRIVPRRYDVIKALKLSVDASQSGLGAALFQDNQPVAYAYATRAMRKLKKKHWQ